LGILSGRGGLKAIIFKGKYEPIKTGIARGVGVQTKNTSVAGVWIFSETATQYNSVKWLFVLETSITFEEEACFRGHFFLKTGTLLFKNIITAGTVQL